MLAWAAIVAVLVALWRVKRQERYVALFNFNPEGGFFWNMHNVCNLLHLCDAYGRTPVVYLNDGYYLVRRPEQLPDSRAPPDNWFEYYFEPLNGSEAARVGRDAFQPITSLPPSDATHLCFTRATFRLYNSVPKDWGALARRALRLRPALRAKLDAFYDAHLAKATKRVAIHYRGTDKYPSHDDDEDGPKHPPYDWCLDQVRRELVPGAVVFVASDEQPFVDRAREVLGSVVATPALRSSVSTSGLDLRSETCGTSKADDRDCRLYAQMRTQAVHKGLPDANPYQKGEDVVMDVMLMARCDVLFKSRGSVSAFPGRLNPRLKQYELVDLWRSFRPARAP